jgi:hypothetical protein
VIIKRIILDNFRNFVGHHEFHFRRLNLIVGAVGSGKSSLGRIAIAFALYGNADVALATLPSRGKSKSCSVTLEILDEPNRIIIQREYPTKLTIFFNGDEVLPGAITPEKEKWIKSKFQDLQSFKKFRMIDLREGVNILEEGRTSLRKTLISFHEAVFNNIRQRLLTKKSHYDKYNRDTAIVYSHAPSQKRLNFLRKSIKALQQEKADYSKNLTNLESDCRRLSRERGAFTSQDQQILSRKKKLELNPECPLCYQSLDNDRRNVLIDNCIKELQHITSELDRLMELIKEQEDAIQHARDTRDRLEAQYNRILRFGTRLNQRIAQKDYKYTQKDVMIAQNAIKELDKFYSYFILQSVKNLEPVINSIICKIGFEINFQLTEKGDFDIQLLKDDEQFVYKDLSSGQRLMLTIAFQIALLLDKGESGFIIADEGFSNLDSESIIHLYEMFSGLPFQLISIIHRFENTSGEIHVIQLGESNGSSKHIPTSETREEERRTDSDEGRVTDKRSERETRQNRQREIRSSSTKRASKSMEIF